MKRLIFQLAMSLALATAVSRCGIAQVNSNDLMHTMSLTSQAFRASVSKIRPSLVTIESFGGVSAIQGRIGGIRKQGEGNTTGILISEQGHIITSTFNFIQSPPVITVITSDGERRVAELLGRDDTRKICLLKVKPFDNLQTPEIVAEGDLTVGQWAISVGVGYGDANPAVSTGIISAKNRIGGRAVQTDANISPANYGGALLDITGRLIGVCVPMDPQNQSVGAGVAWYDSGIGFAIPISSVADIIERLKKGERIYPAFLGVRMEPNSAGEGIAVVEVVADSAAESAGLGPGDAILKLNGIVVEDILQLKKILSRLEAGTEIEIEFKSNLEETIKRATVELGRAPQPEENASPMEPPKIR